MQPRIVLLPNSVTGRGLNKLRYVPACQPYELRRLVAPRLGRPPRPQTHWHSALDLLRVAAERHRSGSMTWCPAAAAQGPLARAPPKSSAPSKYGPCPCNETSARPGEATIHHVLDHPRAQPATAAPSLAQRAPPVTRRLACPPQVLDNRAPPDLPWHEAGRNSERLTLPPWSCFGLSGHAESRDPRPKRPQL